MKYFLGAIGGVIFAILIAAVFMMGKAQVQMPAPTASAVPSQSPSATVSPATVATSTPPGGSGVQTGTIEGKLCYPSQFLPSGAIEAKNTLNNTLISEMYPGSENGGASTYSLAVPGGTYVLRYKAGELYGYHTDICPTGLETSCKAENPRANKQIIVTVGQTVTGVDLCDFYYSEATDPGF